MENKKHHDLLQEKAFKNMDYGGKTFSDVKNTYGVDDRVLKVRIRPLFQSQELLSKVFPHIW